MKTIHAAMILSGCTVMLWMTGTISASAFDEATSSSPAADAVVPAPDSQATNADFAAPKSESAGTEKQGAGVPIAVARDRAKLMHNIYSTTLGVMHDRYFHADRSIVPARAMEDVFSEIEQETGSKANWISVNLKAMSINHEPSTDFEKRAAKEIATGESEVETTEDGYYRRATAIPMTGGCISCHAGVFNQSVKSRKFAALVISIPIETEAAVP